MKLDLDEHFSPTVAEQLRLRGYDVVAAAESATANYRSLRQTPDEELLRRACKESRVLVTENVRDFMPIHRAFLARTELHSGILFTSARNFPRRTDAIGLLVDALAAFVDSHDTSVLVEQVFWL